MISTKSFNLSYAITELQKDVERELLKLPEAERDANRTHFAVFVVHNKLKPKAAEIPAGIPYYPGAFERYHDNSN